jgi:ABC-type branched-subunit amino acid transport system substrate-binding protein/predicted negative regulator of RcsB-dependent stress response
VKTNLLRTALLAIPALFYVGCASTPGVDELPTDGKAVRVEKEARPTYQAAESAFEAKNFTDARRLFQQLRARYPRGSAAAMATYRLGSMAYLEQDYVGAQREFDAFLQKYPRSTLVFDVTYNLAAAEYQLGRHDKAQATLRRLSPAVVQAQDPQRADVVYQLGGQIAGALGDHVQAAVQYAKAAGLATDDHRRRLAAENFDYHLGRLVDRGPLAALEGQVDEPSLRARVSQRMVALERAASPIRETAVAPVEAPTPSTAERMERLLRSSLGERSAVGVVLPLSGSQAPFGKRALDGILLASGVYGGSGDGASIRVYVEDSGGTPVSAAQAVERLVSQRKVMAILGPINWKEALAVAEKAQDMGVPNVSLTTRDGISDRGPFLFQNGLTPRVQLESLVQHCIGTRGFRRFAILAPNDTFGRELSTQFWDLVEAYGGKIVGFEQYAPGAGDFQQPVRGLVGLQDVSRYRGLETGRLAAFVNQVAKKRGGKAPRLELPPVVDFDALFIPDEPKQVAQIASSLAYFDVAGVPLLGTTEWNSDQLFKRGGRLVEGALFPGTVATRGGRKDFARAFADNYGYAPDSLAGQAYEAMELVAAAMRSTASADRAELAQRLASMREYESALGTLSFDERRLAKRRLPVLGLGSDGAITEQR